MNTSNISAASSNGISKKRRHKPIKSCGFCRMRKLKCDHKKPLCSTCSTRGFTTCEYQGSFSTSNMPLKVNHNSESMEGDFVHVTRITKECDHISSDIIPIVPSITQLDKLNVDANKFKAKKKSDSINPLNDLHYFEIKKSGKIINSGPTSLKMVLIAGHLIFKQVEMFQELWKKVKSARNKWKLKRKFIQNNELLLAGNLNLPKPHSLLDNLALILPPFEVIEDSITQFFDKNDIYFFNTILDKNKIMHDLQKCFVLDNRKKNIEQIIIPNKGNHYKVGIILNILNLIYYRSEVPLAIRIYLTHINGFSGSKSFFFEKIQNLLLSAFYNCHFSLTKGDDSNLVIITNSMSSMAILFGLHRDIEELYSTQEHLCGCIRSIRHTWLYILYLDWQVSFNVGRLLNITENEYDTDDLQRCFKSEIKSASIVGKIVRFLKLVRPYQTTIMDTRAIPNLRVYHSELVEFLEIEFEEIGKYTDYEMIKTTDIKTHFLLMTTLSVIITFLSLQKQSVSNEWVNCYRNSIVKYNLLISSISNNILTYGLELDRQHYSEAVADSTPDQDGFLRMNIPPYSANAVAVTHGALIRALIQLFFLIYIKLSHFKNGLLFGTELGTVNIKLNTLSVPTVEKYSIPSIFSMYELHFEQWNDSESPLTSEVYHRSYAFIIIKTITKMCHLLLIQMRSSRIKTENDWIHGNESLVNAGNILQKEIDKQMELKSDELIKSQQFFDIDNINLMGEPSMHFYSNLKSNIDDSIDTETTEPNLDKNQNWEKLSKEFWLSYHTEWENDFNSGVLDDLFKDI